MKISQLIALSATIAMPASRGVAAINELTNESPKVSPTAVFKNPLNQAGADPWAIYHEGFYYFTRTTGNRVDLWKSRTLTGIDHGERKTVYTPEKELKDIWAPEIHRLNGKWYIYYTANTGCGDKCRGIYVLENSESDPLRGTWTSKGRMNTGPGLDATVFQHNGKMYFAFGGYDEFWSSLYLAEMSNPWTLASPPVRLAHRDRSWESDLLEGPEPLIRNGRVFLAYSTFPCWSDNYRLGLLTASASANLLDPSAWSKSSGPVFQSANGVFAAGHNGFTKSKDGTEDWMLYHANSKAGEGCKSRPSRAQKFTWNEDGTPNFGQPAAESTALSVPSGEYTIEAEHATFHQAAVSHRIGASNSRVINLNHQNSFVLFDHINVPKAGLYAIKVRYFNRSRRALTHHVEINGQKASSVTFKGNKGDANFQTVTFRAPLQRGYQNAIRFAPVTPKSNGVELDSIEVTWANNYPKETP